MTYLKLREFTEGPKLMAMKKTFNEFKQKSLNKIYISDGTAYGDQWKSVSIQFIKPGLK